MFVYLKLFIVIVSVWAKMIFKLFGFFRDFKNRNIFKNCENNSPLHMIYEWYKSIERVI